MSCNRVLIGKTYWKSVVLPALLFASSVIVWSRNELERLQRDENKVWRFILGAPSYTAVAALRGDLGASCMKMRDAKTKLKYVRYVMKDSPCNLRRIVLEDMLDKGRDGLAKSIIKYMNELEIVGVNELTNMTDGQINRRVEDLDERN